MSVFPEEYLQLLHGHGRIGAHRQEEGYCKHGSSRVAFIFLTAEEIDRRLSPEDYQHYLELQDRFDKARAAYANGTGTQAELDSAREEMLAHVRSTCNRSR